MTNKILLQEVEKDKEKKGWKEKITKIKKDVMNILKKSKSMKSFYSKTKRSLDSLEKLDKEHRYKLGISIQNWVIFHKPEWKKDLIKYPKPNPKKKYSLSDYVYWDKFDDERPNLNLDLKLDFKIFLENDFLQKYYGLSKLSLFGEKDDILDDFIVDQKSKPFYYKLNYITFLIVKYFEKSIEKLNSEIKDLKQDRIYLYDYFSSKLRIQIKKAEKFINQIENLEISEKEKSCLFNKQKEVLKNYKEQLRNIDKKKAIEIILTSCEKNYSVWTKHISVIYDYALEKKDENESIQEFISTKILKSQGPLPSSIGKTINRHFEKMRCK